MAVPISSKPRRSPLFPWLWCRPGLIGGNWSLFRKLSFSCCVPRPIQCKSYRSSPGCLLSSNQIPSVSRRHGADDGSHMYPSSSEAVEDSMCNYSEYKKQASGNDCRCIWCTAPIKTKYWIWNNVLSDPTADDSSLTVQTQRTIGGMSPDPRSSLRSIQPYPTPDCIAN